MTNLPMVAIVDYRVGNHTSVLRCVRSLGYRAIVSNCRDQLDRADVLILPGVGAFPKAMENLHSLDLVSYLQHAAQSKRTIIGICLGMQLLAENSSEIRPTQGLSLIPGSIQAIGDPSWHIGWNGLEVSGTASSALSLSDGEVMYFNHSHSYLGPDEFIVAQSRIHLGGPSLVSAISRGSVTGLQFHPEKSQRAGTELLARLISSEDV